MESVLDRYRGAVLERHRKPALQAADAWGMELQLLHAACTSILQSLPPATIGGWCWAVACRSWRSPCPFMCAVSQLPASCCAGNAALLKLACSCLSALAVSIGEKPGGQTSAQWTCGILDPMAALCHYSLRTLDAGRGFGVHVSNLLLRRTSWGLDQGNCGNSHVRPDGLPILQLAAGERQLASQKAVSVQIQPA